MNWIDTLVPGYGTVTGQYVAISYDSADPDLTPDVQPLNGTITLTPTVTAGRIDTALAQILAVTVRVFGGQIVDDEDQPGVRIISTDTDLGVKDWAWTARFDFESGLKLKPLTFKVATGETVSLTSGIVPVESAPYQIVQGEPGDSAFEVAARHGYQGTEAQWLESLKGVKGDTPSWGDLPGKPISFPPAAHTHSAIENSLGRMSMDSAGGAQHHVNGDRVWWVNDQGRLVQGAVPWAALDGVPETMPPSTHGHNRIDNALGYLTLDSAGGLQHGAGGSRKFWMDEQGVMQQGTVPWERVTGAPPASATPAALKVVPLALTTGQTGASAATSRSVRVPLRWNAPLVRWRVHIRNWNPRLGTVTAAPVDFTGLWLADSTGGGVVTGTPQQLRGAFTTPADGSEWVSDWYNAPIGGDVERLLCYAYSTATAPPSLTGGSYGAAGTASATSGAVSRASLTAFDLWIEAETPASTPVFAGIGDSLTAGTGANLPVYESWVSQYARRVGGLPMHIAHHGDSMSGFLTLNPGKVKRWASLARADAVVWSLGSNDVASSRTVAQMQTDYASLLPIVEASVGPVRYATTVQPRGTWDAAFEAKRTDWNTWLASRPGVRGVLDFAAVVSTDGDTLRAEYDSGDGTHLNTSGYKAEADSIATSLTAAPVATAARVQSIEDRLISALYMSGPRRLTTLDNGWTGDVRAEVNGRRVTLTVNGINGQNATSEIAFALPLGLRPAPYHGTIRALLHIANAAGATTTYRAYVTSNSIRVTGGQGLPASLYAEPITYLTDDPILATPPWQPA